MSERKSIINISMEPIASVAMLLVIAAGVGVYFLVIGLGNDDPSAYLILGGLATITLGALGSLTTLAVLWIGNKFVRSREETERQRSVDNSKENMDIVISTQRAQNLQNQMLLRQARDTTKMLPGSDDVVEADFLQIDDDIFAELDG